MKSGLLSKLALALLALGVTTIQAQTLTGNLSTSGVSYGSPLAVQTINTGFGTSAGGGDASGSELDAGYGTISGGNLYLFLSGCYQNNGNHLNIFLGSSAGSQSTLNISGGWTASVMNGSAFSPGFNAGLMLDLNDSGGTLYVDQYVLSAGGSANTYLGSVALSSGIGSGTLGSIGLALNNTHTSTMGATGTALSGATSGANTLTGLELAIPLSLLGNPSGSVDVLADINGGNDGYLSNQFLTGLPVGYGNLGGTTFNFSSTPGQFFTVTPAPEPSTLALCGLSGTATLFLVRRRR